MQHATDLHYACLIVLFSQDLHPYLKRECIPGCTADPQDRDSLKDYVYGSYIRLLYESWYDFLSSAIETQTGPRIAILFEAIRDAAPIGNPQVSAPSAQKQWNQWYWKNCQDGASSRASTLVPIAAASGAIRVPLVEHFRLDDAAIRQQARLVAFKAVSRHYARVDEQAPLAGSLSLRQRAEAYLDIQSPLLTERGLQCYRNINQV